MVGLSHNVAYETVVVFVLEVLSAFELVQHGSTTDSGDIYGEVVVLDFLKSVFLWKLGCGFGLLFHF